jgi:hypothetical protein
MSPSFRNLSNRVYDGFRRRSEISEGAGGSNPLYEGEYIRPLGPGPSHPAIPRFAYDFAYLAHNKH